MCLLQTSLYYQHLSTSLFLHALTQKLHAATLARLHKQELVKAAEFIDTGLVYTFGKYEYRLGYHLPNADVQVTPRLVDLPTSSPIVQVSASKYHTIALSAAGECFVWGFGKGGRLGLGDEYDRIKPARVTSLKMSPINKLGHPKKSSSLQSRFAPKRVNAFRLRVATDIAASGCHSAAIAADDGAVYTWGSNRRGQMGRKEGCGTD
ncbi:unnamed protein product [Peronospora belbahrii]|uniref:Uncharacterized protein n=1 Tax=Peronospora belbahrii TaxID=622444 RepID=A0AAU9L0K9_9STRA|nr:unnamed protein product [Peronospora belbahrii]CAH0517736.1 unnamed protein product [Peronospora belbahrii]